MGGLVPLRALPRRRRHLRGRAPTPARTVGERIRGLYGLLRGAYGLQGWWPLPSMAGRRGFDARGYHPGDFEHPNTARTRFEIALGAVLTQNTAWTNVERALAALREAGIVMPGDVLAAGCGRVAGLIRASGYYNQKARKLIEIAMLCGSPGALSLRGAPSRETLLSLWGVGPETADSILLYAFRAPLFVVDAYTRRILGRVGLVAGDESYQEIQSLFHGSLAPDHELFNEYHALLVEHAKRHCRARPLCRGCPVRSCRRLRRAPSGA